MKKMNLSSESVSSNSYIHTKRDESNLDVDSDQGSNRFQEV